MHCTIHAEVSSHFQVCLCLFFLKWATDILRSSSYSSVYVGSPITPSSLPFVQQALWNCLFTRIMADRPIPKSYCIPRVSAGAWMAFTLSSNFSHGAVTVIIFQTGKKISANGLATFHLPFCHSSVSQNPDCKKIKGFRGILLKPSQLS